MRVYLQSRLDAGTVRPGASVRLPPGTESPAGSMASTNTPATFHSFGESALTATPPF